MRSNLAPTVGLIQAGSLYTSAQPRVSFDGMAEPEVVCRGCVRHIAFTLRTVVPPLLLKPRPSSELIFELVNRSGCDGNYQSTHLYHMPRMALSGQGISLILPLYAKQRESTSTAMSQDNFLDVVNRPSIRLQDVPCDLGLACTISFRRRSWLN